MAVTNLAVPRTEASEKIQAQIGRARELHEKYGGSVSVLDDFRAEANKWSDYNFELLRRLFSDDSVAVEYRPVPSGHVPYFSVGGGDEAIRLSQELNNTKNTVQRRISKLESILHRLELMAEPKDGEDGGSGQTPAVSNRVFVVHGHDEGARESVARFVEKLGLNAVILHEQASQGRTLIEKFEHYSDVGFAVVLLTPDDEGYPIGKPVSKRVRARQNVILELGFFLGALGRDRVCALYNESVELPSDIEGLVYVLMDARENWRLELAREIQAAGIDVELKKAL